MDELKLLRDWDAGTRPPRETARLAARERLLAAARAEPSRAERVSAPGPVPLRPRARPAPVPLRGPGAGGPSRRTVVRSLVAAGATAAAVGGPFALLAGDGAAGPAADGADVLRRAARLEREKERMRAPVEPRRGQYVYTRVFVRETADDTGKSVTFTPECWIAADSSRRSWLSVGRSGRWAKAEELVGLWPPTDWRTIAGIPTDPGALLKFLSSPFEGGERRRVPAGDFGGYEWQQSFFFVSGLLTWVPVLPDGLLPAVFEAVAESPGLLVADGAEDAHGRGALTITYRDPQGSPEYLLFASDSYEYLGMRSRRFSGPNEARTFTQLSYLETYGVVDEVKKRP
ncbi:CU044_5270 family protein [Streptomyces sp. CMB-StM0423]|uniref:CU044_5270 family protein n=1 Tax=Streptomyces sp. CMB-StM0423 TaxID=2059884 RepID=UPI000C70F902|nr:CU044_5270 family protein [Streptomyces sp. CMB-StM0423]AUH43479.1 hypothetical protein CXR04_27875 [Streptomyces sp. CMB-StM0423]